MTKWIYIYTTMRHEAHNEYKVGETTRETTVRIKEQDGTSNPHPLKLVYKIEIKDDQSDKEFHRILESKGIPKVRQGREWFQLDIKELKRELHEYVRGVKKLHSWMPRKAQSDAINAILKTYTPYNRKKRRNTTKFLLDAKPRFGKTVTAAWVMEKIREKKRRNNKFSKMRVLVLTNFPATDVEWENTLGDHVDFSNWYFHHAKNGQDSKANMFVFASMQKLMSEDRSDKEALDSEWIYEIDWDAIIIDEEHYGTKTPKQRAIIERLKASFVLSMSGTPFRSKLLGLYEDNVFSFGYMDERRLHDAGVPGYQDSVEMQYYLINPSERLRNRVHNTDIYDEASRPTMSKIFAATEDGNFIRGQAVQNLMEGFFDTDFSSDEIDGISPFGRGEFPRQNDSHILIRMKEIASCKALTKLLEKLVGDRFDIINVAERQDASNTVELNGKIEQSKRKEKGSITITCGSYCTGVTVKPWNVVLWLSDSQSPTNYIQTNYRCQNPDDGKKHCFIVDLCPWRSLKAVYSECLLQADCNHDKVEALISEWLACAPMYHFNARGTLEKIEDVNIVLNASTVLTLFQSLSSSLVIDNSIEQYAQYFKHFKPSKDKTSIEHTVSDDWSKGKNKKMVRRERDLSKKQKKNIMKYVKTFMKNLGRLLIATDDIKSVANLLTDIDDTTFELTGMTKLQFEQLLDEGCLKRDKLDDIIFSIYKRLQAIETAEERVELIRLYKGDGKYCPTPLHIVQYMVARAALDQQSVIWDPACGSGQFVTTSFLSIFNSISQHPLNKLSNKDIAKRIMERHVRGYDCSPLQIKLAKRVFKLALRNLLQEEYESFDKEHGHLVNKIFSCYNTLTHDIQKENTPMKPTNIFMNPPFNKNMHLDFIKKSLDMIEDGGRIEVVCPAYLLVTKLRLTSTVRKNRQNIRNLLSKHTIDAVMIDNPFGKDAKLFVPVVIMSIVKNGIPKITVSDKRKYVSYGGKESFNHQYDRVELKHLDEVSQWGQIGHLENSIIAKVRPELDDSCTSRFVAPSKLKKQKDPQSLYPNKWKSSISTIVGGGWLDLEFLDGVSRKSRVFYCLANKESLGVSKDIVRARGTGGSEGAAKGYFHFDTEEEATNFENALHKTVFFRAYTAILKFDQHTGTMTGEIPDLDWTIAWDDKLLVEHFGLSSDEWDALNQIANQINVEK